ncbi:MAG: tripartite tricarboxylate transporter TctB family protein [Desulfovibrionaceae bacterium]|nr:tripartite tricarboxylate transporter TctB family protein [Desulfovibrionaceae bacterium]
MNAPLPRALQRGGMHTIHKDFVSIVLLVLFILAHQFYLIPVQVIAQGSSETFPHILNALLAICTIFYIYETVRRRRSGLDAKDVLPVDMRSAARPVLLLLSLWIWAELMESFGFIIPSVFLLAATSLLYGERSPRKIAVLAILFPIFAFVFFTILKTTLPSSSIENWMLAVFWGKS